MNLRGNMVRECHPNIAAPLREKYIKGLIHLASEQIHTQGGTEGYSVRAGET